VTAFNFKFVGLTLIAATIAAVAATMSAGIGWPVWAMFVGWVAYFTGGHSASGALRSYICVAIGIALGTVAAISVGTLLPSIDYFAFGVVVFFVAILVVSLRSAPLLNNIPAYFLGLITFFAGPIQTTWAKWKPQEAVRA
jgi:threonine/homoserine efflux transporter RhtA